MSSGVPQPIAGLEELLAACVVFVDAGNDKGTGFMISRDLLVTCRHVVTPGPVGGVVRLRDSSGRSFDATVLHRYPGADVTQNAFPDLAVLQITDPTFGYDLPAVIMNDAAVRVGEMLTIGGYPANTAVGYQTRHFAADGAINYDAGRNAYLRIKDDRIEPGLSGSPVLNEAGFVCGYVRLQMLDGNNLGGFVVPIAGCRELDPDLSSAYEAPGAAAARWTKILSAYDLKKAGRNADGARFERTDPPEILDIAVTRTATQPMKTWTVAAVGDTSCQAVVTEIELGTGVFDAVHHWSGRHPVRSKADVSTLGDLLSRALLPPQIIVRVAATIARGKRPLVRLRVGQPDDLGEIRWEYANLPGTGGSAGRPLAAQQGLAMSRYIELDATDRKEPQDRLQVLVIVAVPAASNFGRGPRRSATSDALGDELASLLDKRARFDVTVLSPPTFSAFEDAIENGSWDLVHLIGYATEDLSGIGFAGYDYTENGEGLIGTPVSSVAEVLQRGRVQAVVLQLFRDDPGHEVTLPNDQLSIELLGGSTRAVVVAEHPLDINPVMGFNDNFYEALGVGEPIEMAVQVSRRAFVGAPPGRDFAAFGAITVTTTRDGHVQLLKRLPERAAVRSGLLPPANDSAKVAESAAIAGDR